LFIQKRKEFTTHMKQILFINNDGGGFADDVEVPQGTTISQFLAERMKWAQPSDYLIRVNRQPVPRDYVLQEGDRVSCTPVKIEGARVRG
jgi:sulfur carrier protein ThiS